LGLNFGTDLGIVFLLTLPLDKPCINLVSNVSTYQILSTCWDLFGMNLLIWPHNLVISQFDCLFHNIYMVYIRVDFYNNLFENIQYSFKVFLYKISFIIIIFIPCEINFFFNIEKCDWKFYFFSLNFQSIYIYIYIPMINFFWSWYKEDFA